MKNTDTDPVAIGKRLRWAREQAGLSQGQVAKMLEFHRPTISQIEAGDRQVRPEEIVKFSTIYGIKESWIIKGDDILKEKSDPRIELAARELAKLSNDDLNALLRLIKVMKSDRS